MSPRAPAHPSSASGPAAEDSLKAVVVLRPIGSPLTVGLSGLGIASLMESGLALGWLSPDSVSEVGIVLIAVPFVLQILACVLAYLARDAATAATVGVLAATWLALGLLHIHSGSSRPDATAGLLLLASGALLAVSASTVSTANPLAATVFALAALRFLLTGIYDAGGARGFGDAASVVGLVIAALVLYAVPAFELEDQRHRAVMPTFRRGRGRSSMIGSADEQLEHIENEPGVRQTT